MPAGPSTAPSSSKVSETFVYHPANVCSREFRFEIEDGIIKKMLVIGGCAGSTAGGLKVARVVILEKASVGEMRRMLHPNAVPAIRFEGKPLSERNIRGVYLFLAVYMAIFVLAGGALALLGLFPLGLRDSLAVAFKYVFQPMPICTETSFYLCYRYI